MDIPQPITLTAKDIRILEEVGNKSFFKTKKGLVISDRQKQLRQMKKQWENHQTP